MAPANYKSRRNGPVLTWTTMSRLRECIQLGQYDTLKIVTGWGLVPDPVTGNSGNWTPANIAEACKLTANIIVRTQVGDGCNPGNGSDRNTNPYAIPDVVVEQVRPWYNAWTARPAPKGSFLIELGNEPNNNPRMPGWHGTGDQGQQGPYEKYIWEWRFYLDKAIDACRSAFPQAKLVSPGLAPQPELPVPMDRNPGRWYEIARDVLRRCDYVGFHVYADTEWKDGAGSSHLARTFQFMQQHFGDKQWVLSEYGINGYLPHGQNPPDIPLSREIKGKLNAGFIHYGESTPTLPDQVWGATYFHLCTDNPYPQGGEQPNDTHYSIFRRGDQSYAARKQNG
jgi:hypothetical protein